MTDTYAETMAVIRDLGINAADITPIDLRDLGINAADITPIDLSSIQPPTDSPQQTDKERS